MKKIIYLTFFLHLLNNTYSASLHTQNEYKKILSSNLKSWQKKILVKHNKFRDKHCTPPLKWNSKLSSLAQNQASKLCKKDAIFHPDTKYGGNIYIAFLNSNSNVNKQEQAKNSVNNWYNESAKYNYNNPIYSIETAHFTQLVWKNTTQIGCGLTSCMQDNQKLIYIDCLYDPPGNFESAYTENVLPKCK